MPKKIDSLVIFVLVTMVALPARLHAFCSLPAQRLKVMTFLDDGGSCCDVEPPGPACYIRGISISDVPERLKYLEVQHNDQVRSKNS